MAILVSGGAGYIGSHTCVELLAAGYDIVVADNYYNSCPEALARVKKIAGKDFRFVEADMTDKDAVEKIFAENEDIDCVIQFAAYKAVGESVSKPIEYYSNNLACTLNILDVMRRHNCHNIIFSSSAMNFLSKYPATLLFDTVYSESSAIAIYRVKIEDHTVTVVNQHMESIGLTQTDKELYHEITAHPNTDRLDEIKQHLLSKLMTARRIPR